MQNRKSFIQNTSIALAGLMLVSKNIFSRNTANQKYPLKLIVIEGVRKLEFKNTFSKVLESSISTDSINFDNVFTEANLDFHSESIGNITELNNYSTFDINSNTSNVLESNCTVITGFDVAHYSGKGYFENIENLENLITNLLSTSETNSRFLILTSMGRNNYENENGGIDHNDDSAKECFAIHIEKKLVGISTIKTNSLRLSTKQIVENFKALL
jgi:hypothetical protein